MTADASRRPLLRPLSLLLTAPALLTGTALAAEWTATPSAQLLAQGQSNPRFADEEQNLTAAFGTQLGLGLTRATERFSLLVQPTVAWHRYQQDTDLDRSDQHLVTEWHWKGEHIDWDGTVSAARDTTLTSERGTTGLTQLNERHESLDVSLGPSWRWSERLSGIANIGLQAARYPGSTSALQDYDYRLATTSLSYVLSDRAALTGIATVGRLIPEQTQLQSDSGSVRLQMQYALSSLWMLQFGAGPSLVRTASHEEHGIVYTGTLARTFERSSLSLSMNRSVSPSGRGVLTQLQDASLKYNAQLDERLSTGCSLTLSRRKDAIPAIETTLSDVSYARADVTASWRVSEHWHLGGGMGYAAQRFEGIRSDADTARGYDVQLTLGWTGDPHVY